MKHFLCPFLLIAILLETINSYCQVPEIQWDKNFGGSNYDDAIGSLISPNNLLVIGAISSSNDFDVSDNNGVGDYWIFEVDSNGIIKWESSFGGSEYETLNSIELTADSGYILCGRSYSEDGDITLNHGNADIWVVKIDSIGALQWQKTYGGAEYDDGGSVKQTNDGGYIITGATKSNDGDVTYNHGNIDAWVIKISSVGEIEWQKTYGGSLDDRARSVELTDDGKYIVGGYSESDDFDVAENKGDQD